MFAGIDIASERHMRACVDGQGAPIGKPIPITEDRAGYDTLLKTLGEPPVLVALEATGGAKNRRPFKIRTEQARAA